MYASPSRVHVAATKRIFRAPLVSKRLSMSISSQVLAAGSVEPTFGEKLTLITTWSCPYAQRSWIAINAKGIPFDTVHVDLRSKPEWFFKHNPLGRVPTVVWTEGDKTYSVYESLVVNEFLAELPGGNDLLPAHPSERGRARIIIDRFGSKFAAELGKLTWGNLDQEGVNKAAAEAEAELQWLESQIHEEGPFFLGEQLTLVDAALAPWFLRLPIYEDFRGWTLDSSKFPKLAKWVEVLKTTPAVTATFQPPKGGDYHEALKEGYKEMLGDRLNGALKYQPAVSAA